MNWAGANGCTSCVLNDLDLKVEKYGTNGEIVNTFYPNGLSRPDDKNNAERVRLDGRIGEAHEGLVKKNDTFGIIVKANNLVTKSQKYALVITGCFGGKGNILDTTDSVFTTGATSMSGWRKFLLDAEDWINQLEDETLYAIAAAGVLFILLVLTCCYACCKCCSGKEWQCLCFSLAWKDCSNFQLS